MPLTKRQNCGKIEAELILGADCVLKYPYQKGKQTYTKKIVRVCDGIVYILDPSTKDQIPVGKALMMGNILVIAMTLQE